MKNVKTFFYYMMYNMKIRLNKSLSWFKLYINAGALTVKQLGIEFPLETGIHP